MKVFIDKELCSGSGICIKACPEVFELDDQGTTSAKNEQVSSEFEHACRNAAEGCPSGAIKVEE